MNSKVKKRSKSTKAGLVISRIFIWTFVLITAYPFIFVILTSLKTTEEFYNNIWLLPEKFRWSNYVDAWTDGNIGEYFFNSIIVVFTSVIIITAIGLLAAYALSRLNIPFSNTILLCIVATAMIPHESIIMPLYIMMSKIGFIGEYLSLILAYSGWGLPITIYILRNFFQTIPNSLLESARIDGATEFKSFYKIMVPLVMPGIATTVILNFVGYWGELIWATVSLSTSSIKTIPIGIIAFQSEYGTNWGTMSAAISTISIPLIVIFVFMQRYFIQGITGGSVKE